LIEAHQRRESDPEVRRDSERVAVGDVVGRDVDLTVALRERARVGRGAHGLPGRAAVERARERSAARDSAGGDERTLGRLHEGGHEPPGEHERHRDGAARDVEHAETVAREHADAQKDATRVGSIDGHEPDRALRAEGHRQIGGAPMRAAVARDGDGGRGGRARDQRDVDRARVRA
jgi:hypothetical protein